MIRVELPAHLRTLAGVKGEVTLDVAGPVTQRSVLDALEAKYPMLEGTIREHGTLKRRAFLRFFACEEDLSHESAGCVAAGGGCDGEGAVAGGGSGGWGFMETTKGGLMQSSSDIENDSKGMLWTRTCPQWVYGIIFHL